MCTRVQGWRLCERVQGWKLNCSNYVSAALRQAGIIVWAGCSRSRGLRGFWRCQTASIAREAFFAFVSIVWEVLGGVRLLLWRGMQTWLCFWSFCWGTWALFQFCLEFLCLASKSAVLVWRRRWRVRRRQKMALSWVCCAVFEGRSRGLPPLLLDRQELLFEQDVVVHEFWVLVAMLIGVELLVYEVEVSVFLLVAVLQIICFSFSSGDLSPPPVWDNERIIFLFLHPSMNTLFRVESAIPPLVRWLCHVDGMLTSECDVFWKLLL